MMVMATNNEETEALGIRPRVCPECPFLPAGPGAQLGSGLRPERRRQIADDMHRGASFSCHMEAHGTLPAGPAGERQCTGAATVLEREGGQNMVMRLAVVFDEPEWVRAERVEWDSLDEWADQ